MIIEFFLIGIIFGAMCFLIGATQQSFPFVYLSMFIFLIMGLFLMSEGLAMATGMAETPVGSGNFITTYTTYTTATSPVINVIATTFFYIPLAGVLLSTLMTLRGWRNRY